MASSCDLKSKQWLFFPLLTFSNQGIVDYFAAKADIAAIDLAGQISEQERRIVDGQVAAKIMEVVRVFLNEAGGRGC